jgi:hypothetical protein
MILYQTSWCINFAYNIVERKIKLNRLRWTAHVFED